MKKKKKKKNILLVEDDCISQLLIRRAIRPIQWINRIDSAFNGQQGLHVLERYCSSKLTPPEIILLDLHMPVMDGFQFIESFNKMDCLREKPVVIIVVSSTESPTEHKRIRSLGVKYVLPKPISRRTLEAIANREFEDL